MNITSKLISTAIAATLLSAPAIAEDNRIQTMEVRTADLDLSSAAGQAQLEKRVIRAARQVCDVGNDYALATATKACFAKAKSDALASINSRNGQVLVLREHR